MLPSAKEIVIDIPESAIPCWKSFDPRTISPHPLTVIPVLFWQIIFVRNSQESQYPRSACRPEGSFLALSSIPKTGPAVDIESPRGGRSLLCGAPPLLSP